MNFNSCYFDVSLGCECMRMCVILSSIGFNGVKLFISCVFLSLVNLIALVFFFLVSSAGLGWWKGI